MASALPSVPVPYDQPLRDLMRDWSPDDLRRALDHVDDAEEARHSPRNRACCCSTRSAAT